MSKAIRIGNVVIGGGAHLALIGGPCVIESEYLVMMLAKRLQEICTKLQLQLVFKASFDKANRSSINSFRGPGLKEGLAILSKVKAIYNLSIITDVHEPWQCAAVADVVDGIQIPAFLARQTDLLVAAAKTQLPINIKKPQFMAPWDMINVVRKIEESGNDRILLCERGTSFGYNTLVVDMRSLPIMRQTGYPIIFDATHSVQKPGGNGDTTGGERQFVAPLMRAAAAVGVDAIFAEIHPDPDRALSDGPNMIALDSVENTFKQILAIHQLVQGM